MWALKVPAKIRIFWWWVLCEAILIFGNLFKLLHHVSPGCQCCEEEVETISHALWGCRRAYEVWSLSSFAWISCDALDLLEAASRVRIGGDDKELKRFVIVAWAIWAN